MTGHAGVQGDLRRVLLGVPDSGEEIRAAIDVRPSTLVTRWTCSGTSHDPRTSKASSLPGTSVTTLRGAEVSSNDDCYGADAFLAALDHVQPTVEALRDRER